MLKRLERTSDGLAAKDVPFPVPFPGGLEYSCPARGMRNIVHIGFLIPEAHEIFVCAGGCLRGVVLTAAEAGVSERFSTIEIRENNVLDGDMEELITEGTADILEKLPYHPRAVLLYTSCIHHFMGCDLPEVFRQLRERFPDIDFTDCYMNPIMRKSGLTPDQLMRRQLYSLWRPAEQSPKQINIIGNTIPTDKRCELFTLAQKAGVTITEIMDCQSYDDYQKMAAAFANISIHPAAAAGGDALQERLGQAHLHLPCRFSYEKITEDLDRFAALLGLPAQDHSEFRRACEEAVIRTRETVGDTSIVIDYTAVSHPLGLARFLLEHGFAVKTIYADSFAESEREDFLWIQQRHPDLLIRPTIHPSMRVQNRTREEKVLSIGQKGAYFTGTPYFVNIVEGGGLYGFTGLTQLMDMLCEAAAAPKDTRRVIQVKGTEDVCV